jgi:hypothetical protein
VASSHVAASPRRLASHCTKGDSSACLALCARIGSSFSADRIQGAVDLEAATGERFCADEPPQFFTGDLDASFVLVHLNPMEHGAEWARSHPPAVSFGEYVRTALVRPRPLRPGRSGMALAI